MFPFWEMVIEPVMRASGARRVVEIGALRGETTKLALDALGPEAELHVIDPAPEFDPTEHERRFPGRYVFHRDLSLNVLEDADAFDLALIDGDHNWYTVYNELRLLHEAARAAGRSMPVLVLHDVCWPYGRRDLYYAPETIPEEHRRPHAQRGMRRGERALLPEGGLNATLHNAEVEGGPRNGVMTALDDFATEHDRPLRRLLIPIYFGLAIVVESELLDRKPELAAVLDDLEKPESKDRLLELSEGIRLDAAVWEHSVDRVQEEKLARVNDRYLELLRAALLDEHYLENEVRIKYLLACAAKGNEVLPDPMRDPYSFWPRGFEKMQKARRSGWSSSQDNDPLWYFPYTAMGAVKMEALDQALRTVLAEQVEGDLVECGCGRGGGGIYLRGFLEAHDVSTSQVWVADLFRARPARESRRPLTEGGVVDLLPDLNQVREGFARFGLLDERVRFLQGRFADTLPDAPIEEVALLRIGAGVGADAATVLEQLYDRVAPGGVVVVEDESDPDCAAAVEAFRRKHCVGDAVERVGWTGRMWRKPDPTMPPAPRAAIASGRVADRAPLAPRSPVDTIDLSVVVVFYNMRREAARTLHSLSRTYQQGIEGLDYEVIVVENGSDEDQRLGEDFVRGFGTEFRYLDVGDDASPSPTTALNQGIRMARGRSLALMVDGAHLLSPGVLRLGMAGLRTYEPAIVATQQWYVGPGQQPEIVEAGYEQTREDELFESIDWPSNGYRVFEISHFIGERDWFDGIWESNCLFVPRSLLEQVGGFDDSFSMPGGGYANLELYERLGAAPGVSLVSILGEGSFHQVHGGTTTNVAVGGDRRSQVFSYGQHYEDLRGRRLVGLSEPTHYVGAFVEMSAKRTRSRRLTATAFGPPRVAEGTDGVPEEPTPIPDELKTAFIEAFWAGLSWKNTTWLGHHVTVAPTDLVVYQELLSRVRPDWVIDVGRSDAGRTLFLGSICELLGHGQVVSVGKASDGHELEHPRIQYVNRPSHRKQAAERVRAIVGPEPHALVVLATTSGAQRVVREFKAYAPFVSVGSYMVVENTIVNGRPVWPGYGPGPTEALRHILALHGDFVQDHSWEKHGLTFNRGGYLRRITPPG